jgi:hypothetical protein
MVRGRKRHLLVDTEGLVLKTKVYSAKIPHQEGVRLLLEWRKRKSRTLSTFRWTLATRADARGERKRFWA